MPAAELRVPASPDVIVPNFGTDSARAAPWCPSSHAPGWVVIS